MIFYHLSELDLAAGTGNDPPQVRRITRGIQLNLLDLLGIDLS